MRCILDFTLSETYKQYYNIIPQLEEQMRFKDAVSYNKYEAETGKRVIKDLMVHFKCNKSDVYKKSTKHLHELVFTK